MTARITMTRIAAPLLVVAGVWLATGRADVSAQFGRGAPPPPVEPQPARERAPVDLTGYWAAAITEDWQWRFVTPARGDYIAVPFNTRGEEVADLWDPKADIAAGLQCKPFGAAAIFRLPTRVHVTWEDPETLKLDFDLGTQTRMVHFDRTLGAPAERGWQGHAIGEWIDLPQPGRGRGRGGAPADGQGAPAGRGGAAAADDAAGGDAGAAEGRGARGGGGRGGEGEGDAPGGTPGGLKVVTTNLRAQYLRMNGVPVSENAIVTDYLDLVPSPTGEQWLIVKTVVEDPTYLSQPYITSSQFKREPDGAKWNPTPCEMLPQVKALPELN